jgi:hypothetical protein
VSGMNECNMEMLEPVVEEQEVGVPGGAHGRQEARASHDAVAQCAPMRRVLARRAVVHAH